MAAIEGFNNRLYGRDFLLTWEKTIDDLKIILRIARALKTLHHGNVSCRRRK